MKKIREVSMMSGITRRTLQYYDDEGILPVERTKENYRLYDEKALRKLWEILIYKEIGLSIEQIKQLFEPGGKAHAEILEKQIQSMSESSTMLAEKIRFAEKVMEHGIPAGIPAFDDEELKETGMTYLEYIHQLKK